MLQEPATQLGVPLALLQAAPHPPQLLVLMSMLISHPFAGLPSQSAKPALQVYWQLPSEQPVAVMLAGAREAQFAPHAPQFERSVFVLTSQPSACPPLQSAKPGWQA